MKHLLLIWYCLAIFWAQAQTPIPDHFYANGSSGDFTQALFGHTMDEGAVVVGLYNKLEYGLILPPAIQARVTQYFNRVRDQSINPFDPDEIDVYAEFKHISSGKVMRVNGFYYEHFERDTSNQNPKQWTWVDKPSEYVFRIRFSATDTGVWQAKTVIHLPREQETLESNPFAFMVEPSSNPGFLGTVEGGHYLRHSNGQDFFAIGQNLAWSNPYNKLQPYSTPQLLRFIDELGASGANATRIGTVSWSHGIEWEEAGNYGRAKNVKGKEINRQINAWEFDQVIETLGERGVYACVFFDVHDELMDSCELSWIHPNNSWYNHPYSKLGIEREGFFTDSAAISYYKKKVRYIVARWGYSANILCYEILSEIDNFFPKSEKCGSSMPYHSSSGVRQKLVSWYKEMIAHIHELDHSRHLISGSYARSSNKNITSHIWPHVDLILEHKYTLSHQENYTEKPSYLAPFKKGALADKPLLLDETGPVNPEIMYVSDITLHNNLWSTAFMGTFGNGMAWWWDRGLHTNGYFKQYRPFSTFMMNEELNKYAYEPVRYHNKGKSSRRYKKASYEVYALASSDRSKWIGWVHNTSFWLPGLRKDNAKVKDLFDKDVYHVEAYNHYKDKFVLHVEGKPFNYLLDEPQTDFNSYSGEVVIKGLEKGEIYEVEYWSTQGKGGIFKTEKLTCGRKKLILQFPKPEEIPGDYEDFALKITKVN